MCVSLSRFILSLILKCFPSCLHWSDSKYMYSCVALRRPFRLRQRASAIAWARIARSIWACVLFFMLTSQPVDGLDIAPLAGCQDCHRIFDYLNVFFFLRFTSQPVDGLDIAPLAGCQDCHRILDYLDAFFFFVSHHASICLCFRAARRKRRLSASRHSVLHISTLPALKYACTATLNWICMFLFKSISLHSLLNCDVHFFLIFVRPRHDVRAVVY